MSHLNGARVCECPARLLYKLVTQRLTQLISCPTRFLRNFSPKLAHGNRLWMPVGFDDEYLYPGRQSAPLVILYSTFTQSNTTPTVLHTDRPIRIFSVRVAGLPTLSVRRLVHTNHVFLPVLVSCISIMIHQEISVAAAAPRKLGCLGGEYRSQNLGRPFPTRVDCRARRG